MDNIGQYGLGNIDLYNRPIYIGNDGSISTVRSMSFNDGQREVLIPTISDDGRLLNDNEAIQHYYQTGKYLGYFNTPQEANYYAQMLHLQQERLYPANRYNNRLNQMQFNPLEERW